LHAFFLELPFPFFCVFFSSFLPDFHSSFLILFLSFPSFSPTSHLLTLEPYLLFGRYEYSLNKSLHTHKWDVINNKDVKLCSTQRTHCCCDVTDSMRMTYFSSSNWVTACHTHNAACSSIDRTGTGRLCSGWTLAYTFFRHNI
jgi:hypothetical protein